MTILDEFPDAAAGALGVAASLVRIGRGAGRGAGIVLSPGHVVTNAHNLRGNETTVTLADGRVATGTVAGLDRDGDLAVLAVDTGDAPAAAWAPDVTALRPGTPVWSVVPIPGGGSRVTVGAVSCHGRAFRGPGGRRIAGSIEHTAPLARGSSGSPVVDRLGRVVGLNTNRVGDGFYLALPADTDLRARLDQLARGENPQRVALGVALAPPEAARQMRAAVGLPAVEGLLVRAIEEGSPAAIAGLAVGDLVASAAGRLLRNHDDLLDVLDTVSAGDTLELAVVRGAETRTITVAFLTSSAETG